MLYLVPLFPFQLSTALLLTCQEIYIIGTDQTLWQFSLLMDNFYDVIVKILVFRQLLLLINLVILLSGILKSAP